ncbi:MAG: hypothetical protein HN509_18400 [Halobacteriovoraceae bacterium]|jgi:hypothetical protein|nr:hypothetical protein [Halobacteriovoraceae bacterium]MBT5096125.1 hypothetical protein [Halobacteriovoraceae bacterium]
MTLDLVFGLASDYLIEFMGFLLILGLGFRWASYRNSKIEDAYFSTFTSEVEKVLSSYKTQNSDNAEEKIEDVDAFLNHLLDDVHAKLPKRTVRNASADSGKAESLGAKNVVSLRDYVSGDQSLFLGIKSEASSFKSHFPPNFSDLSDRILEHDQNWNKLLRFFPTDAVSRMIDTLPGLFVVFGIFGTFIGISMALPEIAKMDFNNLEGSGEILTQFVLAVTYAMKTSIAGILFSLVMTILNTAAPTTGLRRKTYKKVSNCFENIWLSIHGKQTAEQELQECIPKLLEEVREIKQQLNTSNNEKQKYSA